MAGSVRPEGHRTRRCAHRTTWFGGHGIWIPPNQMGSVGFGPSPTEPGGFGGDRGRATRVRWRPGEVSGGGRPSPAVTGKVFRSPGGFLGWFGTGLTDLRAVLSGFERFLTKFLGLLQPEVIDTVGSLQTILSWWREVKDVALLRGAIDRTGFGDLLEAMDYPSQEFSRTAIQALVERWSETTHTFHLPMGELTVTPSDIVAITGLPWTDQTIEFDVFCDRFPDDGATKARIRELLGDFHGGKGERMSYTHLYGFWSGQVDFSGPRLHQFVRSFILVLLSTLFFPVASSKVNYGLLEALADVDRIPLLNWPRAILGQLYYGLDLHARCIQRSFMGSRLVLLVFLVTLPLLMLFPHAFLLTSSSCLLQIWCFEYGILPRPLIGGDRAPTDAPVLEQWMKLKWGRMAGTVAPYRRMLRRRVRREV